MDMPLGRSYRLAERSGVGLVCDREGVCLGGVDLVRVHPGARKSHCEVRSCAEIGHILQAAYGPQPNEVVARIQRRLHRAASWLEAGDLGRAGIEAVGLGLPDLTSEAVAKLALIADLEKLGDAWRNEPRIPGAQTGGGEWTSGGGGATTRKPTSAASSPVPSRSASPHRYPKSSPGRRSPAPLLSTPPAFQSQANGLRIPVSTVAIPLGGLAPAGRTALPAGVGEGARAGIVGLLSAWLSHWTEGRQNSDIQSAMTRFQLKSNRPADVMAATAYVWSQYRLWTYDDNVPRNGPKLDAASQAVMRLVLVNPAAFAPVLQGQRPSSLIKKVAEAGIADYVFESARPPGVDRRFQTTSASAWAAVDKEVEKGKYIAHHLIAPNVWKDHIADVALAYDAKWDVDAPSNIILLPKDEAAQRELAPELPIHRGPHPIYDAETPLLILNELAKRPEPRTPTDARAVFEEVARKNKDAIRSGAFHPWLKIGA